MQKQKENLFSEKFRLLNSQENVEEIKWSSSDTSDIENVSRVSKCPNLSKKVQRKRKRRKTGSKNVSNLSVTILDTSKNQNEKNSGHVSPILCRKEESKATKSPTFPPTPQYCRPHKCSKIQPSSPVLTCKVPSLNSTAQLDTSPILSLKHCFSPKVSPKIRKKLFHLTQNEPKIAKLSQIENDILAANENVKITLLDRRKSEELVSTLDTCKIICPKIKHHQTNLNRNKQKSFKKSNEEVIQPSSSTRYSEENINTEKVKIEIPESQEDVTNITQQCLDHNKLLLKTSNTELVKRTRSYFDSHFSSDSASQTQHSISDCPTQKDFSKNSDDIEIVSISTQINSNRNSFQSDIRLVSKNPSPVSSQSAECGAEKSKKIRYKKDGLAYRLNALLKKQNANISLWQHERFLADNSNFVIPKGEHLVFLIQKVTVRFGCYLLECIDVNDSSVLILISSIYVQDSNISQNMVFKLFEPYRTLEYQENCMLVINVCKFECKAFKE